MLSDKICSAVTRFEYTRVEIIYLAGGTIVSYGQYSAQAIGLMVPPIPEISKIISRPKFLRSLCVKLYS
jgi:hypothetical protein